MFITTLQSMMALGRGSLFLVGRLWMGTYWNKLGLDLGFFLMYMRIDDVQTLSSLDITLPNL